MHVLNTYHVHNTYTYVYMLPQFSCIQPTLAVGTFQDAVSASHYAAADLCGSWSDTVVC